MKYDRAEEEKLFNEVVINDQNRNPNDPAFFLTEDPNREYNYNQNENVRADQSALPPDHTATESNMQENNVDEDYGKLKMEIFK